MEQLLENDHAAAALQRAASIHGVKNRPSQRRAGANPDAPAVAYVHARDVTVTDNSDQLRFTGYASITNTGYEMYDMFGPYTEIVDSGAFAASLARTDLDVPLVLSHDSLRRIARTTNGTLRLAEDSTGLRVNADLDPADQDVSYIAGKLRSGLIDEMSFKFQITSGQWSPDFEEFRIRAADIHRGDVAIVGYGANPHTAGAGLRSQILPAVDRLNLAEAQMLRDRVELRIEHLRLFTEAMPWDVPGGDDFARLVHVGG